MNDMNAIMKAIKRYRIRRLSRKLKNEPANPSFCIVTINEEGKQEIYMMAINKSLETLRRRL